MPFPEAVSAVTTPRSQNRTSEVAALALDSGPSCFTLKSAENGKLLTPSRHPVIGVCSLSLCQPEEVSLALWMETLPSSPPPLCSMSFQVEAQLEKTADACVLGLQNKQFPWPSLGGQREGLAALAP